MASRSFADLPAPALKRILQFRLTTAEKLYSHWTQGGLPYFPQQVLCIASLVCKSWREAALDPCLWCKLVFSSQCTPDEDGITKRLLTDERLTHLVARSCGSLHTLDLSAYNWTDVTIGGVIAALEGYQGKFRVLKLDGVRVPPADSAQIAESTSMEIRPQQLCSLAAFCVAGGVFDVATSRLCTSSGTGGDLSSGVRCGRLCASSLCDDCGVSGCASCLREVRHHCWRDMGAYDFLPSCAHVCWGCYTVLVEPANDEDNDESPVTCDACDIAVYCYTCTVLNAGVYKCSECDAVECVQCRYGGTKDWQKCDGICENFFCGPECMISFTAPCGEFCEDWEQCSGRRAELAASGHQEPLGTCNITDGHSVSPAAGLPPVAPGGSGSSGGRLQVEHRVCVDCYNDCLLHGMTGSVLVHDPPE